MTSLEFNHQLLTLESNLSKYALGLTSNKNDAKDLLQDTLMKAIIYKDQFVQETNLQAWTITIMKNTFINNYRRNLRENIAFDYTIDLYLLSQNKSTINDVPDSVYSVKEISKVINSLEDNFRILFKMHLEGYKYKEIAHKLNLNIGTVKSRIFIARKKLMDSLKNY